MRPGNPELDTSITPHDAASASASASGRLGYPKPKANPVARKMPKCSMLCETSVTGLCDGGTKDKIKIATASSPAAPRDIVCIQRIIWISFALRFVAKSIHVRLWLPTAPLGFPFHRSNRIQRFSKARRTAKSVAWSAKSCLWRAQSGKTY
jgi:hypothetical protein